MLAREKSKAEGANGIAGPFKSRKPMEEPLRTLEAEQLDDGEIATRDTMYGALALCFERPVASHLKESHSRYFLLSLGVKRRWLTASGAYFTAPPKNPLPMLWSSLCGPCVPPPGPIQFGTPPCFSKTRGEMPYWRQTERAVSGRASVPNQNFPMGPFPTILPPGTRMGARRATGENPPSNPSPVATAQVRGEIPEPRGFHAHIIIREGEHVCLRPPEFPDSAQTDFPWSRLENVPEPSGYRRQKSLTTWRSDR